jgi:hypothetical protein
VLVLLCVFLLLMLGVSSQVLLAMKQYDEVVAITTQLIHNKFSSTKLLQLRARAFYYLVRPQWRPALVPVHHAVVPAMSTSTYVPRHVIAACAVAPPARLWVEAAPSPLHPHRVTGLHVLESVSLMCCTAFR